MTYTPYSTGSSTGTTNSLSYSDFDGDGISSIPSYLYFIGMGTSERPLPGYVFTSRRDARTARRTLTVENPGASFKMYRVLVGSEVTRTS